MTDAHLPPRDKTRHVTRRALIQQGLAAGAVMVAPQVVRVPAAGAAATTASEACSSPAFRNSLSVSPFANQMIAAGITFTDGARKATSVKGLQKLFNAHGATEVYARIATKKVTTEHGASSAESGWARGLERARLAHDLGMPFNPELGLWAEYGDASTYQQPPDFSSYPEIRLPGPWLSLTIDQMVPVMHHYGALVSHQILSTGATVNLWDLGNEVEFGIAGVCVRPLFPSSDYVAPDRIDPAIGQMSVGQLIGMSDPERIAWLNAHLWPDIGKLLAAVAAGIRSVQPSARFSTHVAGLGAKGTGTWTAFWDAMHKQGYVPDQFGTSFYPTAPPGLFPAHPVGIVEDAARELRRKYHRPTVIAEGGYPSGQMPPPYIYNSPVSGYPQDVDGQARFIRDFVTVGVKEGWLGGMRPWAPDLCNGGWAPMSFFTLRGQTAIAKPALGSIADAVRHTKGCIAGKLEAQFLGRRARNGLAVGVHLQSGTAERIRIQLRRRSQVLAAARLGQLGTQRVVVLLHTHDPLGPGRYTVTLEQSGRTVDHAQIRVN